MHILDGPGNWQLCKIAHVLRGVSETESDEWNGIFHRPTWTYFKIEGKKAKVVAMAEPLESPVERDLKARAVKWFYSGLVSVHPPEEPEPISRPKRIWSAQLCRPRQISGCDRPN
jgi:hypothetical protein